MRTKIVLIIIYSLVALLTIGYAVVEVSTTQSRDIKSPIATAKQPEQPNQKTPQSVFALQKGKTNIILLGIDRRSKAETGYRSDIMILVSINPETNKAVLTSVPRDLWAEEGGRVNALFVSGGWETVQKEFEEITGMKADKYIMTDFADFSWIVDSIGGVTVDIANTFTDTEYPEDVTKTYQTVSFASGTTKLNGTDALVFARSRHGNNGEGSDWARQKRQHLLLKGILESFFQPASMFKNMKLEDIFKLITTGHMETNLDITDLYYLYDLYKDRDKYVIESAFVNDDFVYNPPMSEYGGAWVLAPKGGSFEEFHKYLDARLNTHEATTSEEL